MDLSLSLARPFSRGEFREWIPICTNRRNRIVEFFSRLAQLQAFLECRDKTEDIWSRGTSATNYGLPCFHEIHVSGTLAPSTYEILIPMVEESTALSIQPEKRGISWQSQLEYYGMDQRKLYPPWFLSNLLDSKADKSEMECLIGICRALKRESISA